MPEQRGPGLGGRDLRVWGRRSRSLGQSLEGLPLKLPPSRWGVEETRCSEEVKEGLPAQGDLSRLTQRVFHLVGMGGDGRMADSGGDMGMGQEGCSPTSHICALPEDSAKGPGEPIPVNLKIYRLVTQTHMHTHTAQLL